MLNKEAKESRRDSRTQKQSWGEGSSRHRRKRSLCVWERGEEGDEGVRKKGEGRGVGSRILRG